MIDKVYVARLEGFGVLENVDKIVGIHVILLTPEFPSDSKILGNLGPNWSLLEP